MVRPSPFLLLCAAGLAAIFSSTVSKSPVLPLFAQHLGADPAGIGLVAAASALAGVLLSVPAGLLADRFGKTRLLLAASLVFASAPFGYLLVANTGQLVLVRLYHGMATAVFVPVAMAMVAGISSKERGEKLGWFSTATLAGRFLAPLTGGFVLGLFPPASATGFRVVYLLCGGAGLTALLLAFLLPASPKTDWAGRSWSATLATFRHVVLRPAVILTCMVEAGILFAYGSFETFLPLHVLQQGGNAAQAGILLSSQIVVLALSKPVMGRFSDRHGRRPQIVGGGLLGALCIAGFAQAGSFPALLALSIGFGLCLSVVTAATSAHIADLCGPEASGSAMGLLGSVMDIGHTTGPLVSGMVAALLGFGPAFIAAGLVLLALTLVFSGFHGTGTGNSQAAG